MVKKVFNFSELHLSEVTYYKTHILNDTGGFQLLDLIITELKNHVIPYKFEYSHWWKIYLSKYPLQDLPSSLNPVISTNERS